MTSLKRKILAGVRSLLVGEDHEHLTINRYRPIPWANVRDCYEYLPLEYPSSIRLLSIHSSSDAGVIICTLDVADLSSNPQYYALSYTWGAPTIQAAQRGMTDSKCCSIICNGWDLQVTENLFHFLRHAAKDSASGPWWIDAICINQENIMERNQQVLKMKDIYANASHVFVWLGEEDEYTRPALELLITLGSKDLDVLREVDPLSPWAETKPRTREVLGLSIEEGDWKALAYFYRRAWFSRVWILQEVRMAQRTVYYCGNYNVSMDNLFHVAAYIERSYWAPAKGFTMNDGTSPYERPSVLSTRHALLVLYHIFYREYNFGSRLATAIMNGRASHSSDPRDKVYGLLGFFEGSLEEREFCKLMSPDYRKSISQIYVEAAEYILKSMGDLLILSFVEDRLYRSTEGLPSWVPDFSVQGATGVGYTKRTTYRASRDLPAVWQKNASMALILKASQIDVISDTGESKFELVNEYRCVRLLRIIVEMNDYYFNGQTIVEALWRTLIEDCGSHLARTKYESPAPKTFEVAFKSFWLSNAALWLLRPGQVENRENIFDTDIFISGLLLQLAQKDTCGVLPGLEEIVNFARHAGLAHFAEVVNDEYEQQVKTADPYSVAFNQTSWLRFFCTEGKLMGMGPFSLQVGDSIWLVPGSEVLIVLRKGSGANRYELVGDCYVHGLMGGEAVDEALPRMQTIELE